MPQYFENDKNLKSQLKKINYSIFNKNFTFYTDNGVFAKNGVVMVANYYLKQL